MQTTTFYAYKGGTGRTLTLANAAEYLSRLGQSVFAIDLDLEAPGLHHKLRLGSRAKAESCDLGLVDYLHTFATTDSLPDSLAPYVSDVAKEEDRDGRIRLMAAGNVLDPAYWKKLASINWHDFLFGKTGQGLLFFLELKARIQRDYQPDFLLVDARTGITEVGGVATTLLPDQVVCFLTNSRENLEGTRTVLRAIQLASAKRPSPIQVVPVVARLPRVGRAAAVDGEARLVNEIKAYLSEVSTDGSEPLELHELFLLHSEENLAYNESLRIGSNRTVENSPLLRDYLRLFSQIIPNSAVIPHLDRLVQNALNGLLDNPERAQGDLEALAVSCPHATSYMALLKLYRVRSVSPKEILRTAVRYWDFSRDSGNPLLLQVLTENFKQPHRPSEEDGPQLADFIESVWRASQDRDGTLGLRVAEYLFAAGRGDRAVDIVETVLGQPTTDGQVACEAARVLVHAGQFDRGLMIIDQWAAKLADNPDFQAVWASAVVRKADSGLAKQLFESKHFRPAIVLNKSPHWYIRLLMLAGKQEELKAALTRQLEQALAKEDYDDILSVARVYDELGRMDEFKNKVQETVPRNRADRIISLVNTNRTRGTMKVGGGPVFWSERAE